MATICISPPDRFSHSRAIRYSSAEKISKHSLQLPGAKARLLARDVQVARYRQRRKDAPVVRHPAHAASRRCVCVGSMRDVAGRRSGCGRGEAASARGWSAASWSCRRRWGPAAPALRPRASCKRHAEQRLRLAVEGVDVLAPRGIACADADARRLRGLQHRAHDFNVPRLERCHPRVVAQLRRACLAAMTWPQWMTRDAVGQAEQEFHVVFDDDDAELCASVRWISSVSRAAAFGCPGPAVGSSRNSSRGFGGQRQADFQRAALAVGQAGLHGTSLLGPARPTRASTAAASPCAAASRPRSRHIDQPRSRRSGGRARSGCCRCAVSSASNRFMIWNERDKPLARDAAAATGR